MVGFYDTRSTDIPSVDERLALVVRLVAQRRPERILDLACGRGVLLAELARVLPDAMLAGADVSLPAVEQARARGFDVTQADVAHTLPFADESFDCIVFGEVIEHIVDPDFALQEISRVLCKGGTLVVTTPNLASWCNRLLLLVGIQPICTETSLHVNLGRRFKFLGQWRPAQGHLKLFTVAALSEMLEANGYHTASFRGAPFPEANPFSGIDRFISRVPQLAPDIVALATNGRTLTIRYPTAPGWH